MTSRTHAALYQGLNDYKADSARLYYSGRYLQLLSPLRLAQFIWDLCYVLVQTVIVYCFKPPPPKTPHALANRHGRVAVIGAGITGISSAAHAIAHGFEVIIFEAGPKTSVGGIWSNVNTTSGLQLNSLLYRFHPAVIWSKAFPKRDEILEEVRRIWKEYQLAPRTRFNTPVTSVKRDSPPKGESEWKDDPDRSRWIINDGREGVFDAVIVTIGTCGEPNWIQLPGMPEDVGQEQKQGSKKSKKRSRRKSDPTQDNGPPNDEGDQEDSTDGDEHAEKSESTKDSSKKSDKNDLFTKTIIHSSQLDSPSFKLKGGEKVVVIGSGASGVEAVETVLENFGSVADSKDGKNEGVEITMIARNDKWIIPRNTVVDTCIAGQPFGRQMPLSFLWETFLKYWHYRGIHELTPKDLGIYEGTPIVNDEFLGHVKSGRCRYVRGSPVRLTSEGVIVEARQSQKGSTPKNANSNVEEIEEGQEKLFEADVIVLATGFKQPSIDFLPKDLFPDGYQRPNLYLQNFSTEDWSILMTNSAYMNAIGTVGHFHIGIYTRILLTLIMDKNARPSSKDMKLWVDVLRFLKKGATGGALGFFTYMELTIWLLAFHLFRPDRLKWLFFIMNGWGVVSESSSRKD
ncbi:hypothetical protein D9613_009188 [Agrocybe pediades]|uniref:FAD/NAD(P)-binding domain-containing protein n=1 Tax=Agrocybe pediades TaxID=84607 RepID=A0A8H4R576_9AGAR|nr:hypothetical protein D9613_009188 [Agrocybe pediades]